LLQQLALAQTVPTAIADDEPEREALFALASLIAPQDVQLYYQIAIHGRKDLALAPDEHAGFNMTLLRMLAFHPAHAQPDSVAAPRNNAAAAASRPAPAAMPAQPDAGTDGSAAARALLAGLGNRKPASRPVAQEPAAAADAEPEPAPAPLAAPAPAPSVTPVAPAAPPVAAPAPEAIAVAAPSVASEDEQRDDDEDDAELDNTAPWDEAEAEESMPAYAMAEESAAVEASPYEFDGDWGGLVTQLGTRLGASRMLAHNAVLKGWSQSRLELAVPDSFRHMATRDYQEKLKTALAEQFGHAVELVVTIEELGLETPAMQGARHRQEQLAQARICLENDPVIQQLVRDMGATLIAETIQPVQEL
uniref:DNA polymerase III subunit gamma/tau n=1 Tax=Anopheles coluzzii TaxID=1518534 RepID=A0A8W7PWC1_ANOCL